MAETSDAKAVGADGNGPAGGPGPGPDPYGRDEMNLAEFPITLLTDRAPAGLTMITRAVEARDERTGVRVTRKVTVTASGAYGLPTAQDNLVLLGLIYLSKRSNDFRSRRVWFTRAELLRVLGWPDTGPSYARVKGSFCRWANVFVLYENAWWERPRQAYSTRGFGIIDDFELVDGSRSSPAAAPGSNFAWNEVFFQSLADGFVRGLDLKTLLGLRHPTSRQMYRYLGKHFYRSPAVTVDLRAFACEHVGLDRGYKDSGKLKEKLRPALAELESIGFLEPSPPSRRYAKVGRGAWTITLVRGRRPAAAAAPAPVAAAAAAPAVPAPAAAAAPVAPPGVAGLLVARGVTPAAAGALAGGFAEGLIRAKVEAFDWLVARGDRRVSRNPAGYLAESVRKDYAPPPGFAARAERDRRAAAAADGRRAADAARARDEADRRARAEADRARVAAHLDALTPAGRDRLEAEALADPALAPLARRLRRSAHDPDGAARYRALLLEAHVLARLECDRGGGGG